MSTAREHETTFAAAYTDDLTIPQREALAAEAVHLIDQTFDDLAAAARDQDQGWDPATIALTQLLPRRYRRHYDRAFMRAFLITLSTVVWKLAQPLVIPLSSTAEQLAAHALIAATRRQLETQRQGQGEGHHGHSGDSDFQAFAQTLFPDLDAAFLFEDARDGLDVGELMFGEWFTRFAAPTEGSTTATNANATPVSYPYVHPYGPFGPTTLEA